MNLDRVYAMARTLHLQRERLTCNSRGCPYVARFHNTKTGSRWCRYHARRSANEVPIVLCSEPDCESRGRVRNIRTKRITCERHARGKTEAV